MVIWSYDAQLTSQLYSQVGLLPQHTHEEKKWAYIFLKSLINYDTN